MRSVAWEIWRVSKATLTWPASTTMKQLSCMTRLGCRIRRRNAESYELVWKEKIDNRNKTTLREEFLHCNIKLQCNSSHRLLVRHDVAISIVILEFQEITLRSAVSTLPGHASLATAGCEALGTI